MELTRFSAVFVIVGFVIFWIGNLYSPPGIYQEADQDMRLQIISDHPARFAWSQGLGGAGVGIVVLGMLFLSVQSASDHGPWLTYLPAALNLLALVLLSIWLYQYITDPASVWGATEQSALMLGATLMLMAAGILYGFLFLQLGLPGWLSYLTIGFAAIAVVAIVTARPPAFAVISLYLFILLVVAVDLFRR